MSAPRIAVVGAGMAGLACAALLREAGHAPLILDKGRAVGGRLASRGRDGWRWDHGAPGVAAVEPGFNALLDAAVADGAATPWPDFGSGAVTGQPHMRGLPEWMARGLDVRTGREVARIVRDGAGWRIEEAGGEHIAADIVICTTPAPQARRLFGDAAWTEALSGVAYDPCWALMLAFEAPAPAWPPVRHDIDAALGLVVHDGAKPGRDGAPCWVVHAAPGWSRQHLELTAEEAAARLIAHLGDVLGPLPPLAHASAHRWRFARTARSLGQPCLADPSGTAWLGGDWCLGSAAEDAWRSGRAIASAVLARIGPAGET